MHIATDEEMQQFMGIIIQLHECATYCGDEALALSQHALKAKGQSMAHQAMSDLLETALGDESPMKVSTGRTESGLYQFHFVTPARLSDRVGRTLFFFTPPPLCPGKLLFKPPESDDDECAPKGRLLN